MTTPNTFQRAADWVRDAFHDTKERYNQESDTQAFRLGLDPKSTHNGEWDAFRHCHSSASMTVEYGATAASVAGTGRELLSSYVDEPPQSRTEMDMDIHNNAVGRYIGEYEPKDSLVASDKRDISTRLADRCKEALDKGVLVAKKPSGGSPPKPYPSRADVLRPKKPGGPSLETRTSGTTDGDRSRPEPYGGDDASEAPDGGRSVGDSGRATDPSDARHDQVKPPG
jgi:hypothetical protein